MYVRELMANAESGGPVPKKSYRVFYRRMGASPGSFNVDRVRRHLHDVEDLHDLRNLLASALVSEATGVLFGTIANIMGYNTLDCASVLSPFKSLCHYNSTLEIIEFHHRRSLLDYISSPRSGAHYIDVQAIAIQALIRMFESPLNTCYKGGVTFSTEILQS